VTTELRNRVTVSYHTGGPHRHCTASGTNTSPPSTSVHTSCQPTSTTDTPLQSTLTHQCPQHQHQPAVSCLHGNTPHSASLWGSSATHNTSLTHSVPWLLTEAQPVQHNCKSPHHDNSLNTTICWLQLRLRIGTAT